MYLYLEDVVILDALDIKYQGVGHMRSQLEVMRSTVVTQENAVTGHLP